MLKSVITGRFVDEFIGKTVKLKNRVDRKFDRLIIVAENKKTDIWQKEANKT